MRGPSGPSYWLLISRITTCCCLVEQQQQLVGWWWWCCMYNNNSIIASSSIYYSILQNIANNHNYSASFPIEPENPKGSRWVPGGFLSFRFMFNSRHSSIRIFLAFWEAPWIVWLYFLPAEKLFAIKIFFFPLRGQMYGHRGLSPTTIIFLV